MSLSEPNKTRAPHGCGYYFNHTNPQRRVPCILGNMLAPLTADDIPPITPEAMASVQAALALLADIVEDRDFGLYLAESDERLKRNVQHAKEIRLVAKGLTGILRVDAGT